MNKIQAFLAALVLLCTTLVGVAATSAPAHAGYPGAEIYHVNDEGFDDPWSIYCDSGRVVHLYEGQWSKNFCADVDYISVLSGRKVVCYNRFTGDWRTFWPGVTYISSNWYSANCVHQLT